jgi:hypothetical protein
MQDMRETREELTAAAQAVSSQPAPSSNPDVEFRRDMAFPRFNGEMLQNLLPCGQEEVVPKDTLLYTYSDRDTDMIVLLSGRSSADS